MQNKYDKWKKWLTVIESEITNLHRYQNIFNEVQEIIENNKLIQKPSSFYEFLAKSYVALIVMGIRRQIKIDKDSISFARLLAEIVENPQVITRETFVAMYTNKSRGNRDFDQFTEEGKNYVNPNIIREDLEKLRVNGKIFEDYADKKIAHNDKRKPKKIPTYKETDLYINGLGNLLKRYVLLFRAEGLMQVLPVYQYDWKEIFTEPWIRNI